MLRGALDVAAALVSRLSLGALARLARGLAPLLRVRREHVRTALARAGLPEATVAGVYVDLVRGALELLWLSGLARRAPAETEVLLSRGVEVDDRSRALIDGALAAGPVVFAASHTGNWEIAAYWAAGEARRHRKRMAALVRRQGARGADAFIGALRRAFGLEAISDAEPRGFSRAVRVLREGGAVAAVIDQRPVGPSVTAPFLGAPARVDLTFATLAARASATVLFVAARRREDRWVVHVLDRAEPPRSRAGREALARRGTRLLEAFVRVHPRAYLWLHERWGSPRAARRDERRRALWGIRAEETHHVG